MVEFIQSVLFVLTVLVVVVVLPLSWLARRRRARRRKEQKKAELFERPYTEPTSFSFRFESTHRDLLDAYAAQQFWQSALCPVERVLVLTLGIFWMGCVIVFGPRAIRDGRWWQLLILFCLGSSIIWKHLVKPFLTRRRIRQTNSSTQPLAVDFADSGAHIEAAGIGVFDRAWEELCGVELADKGIAVVFSDGIVNWLPNRVFRGEDEREDCAAYLMSKLPKENQEGMDAT